MRGKTEKTLQVIRESGGFNEAPHLCGERRIGPGREEIDPVASMRPRIYAGKDPRTRASPR